jgi:hypothetical protein
MRLVLCVSIIAICTIGALADMWPFTEPSASKRNELFQSDFVTFPMAGSSTGEIGIQHTAFYRDPVSGARSRCRKSNSVTEFRTGLYRIQSYPNVY